MKLTKKHIGRMFDVQGGDGSWFYILIDVSKNKKDLLFKTNDLKLVIDTNKFADWRPYNPLPLSPLGLMFAWESAEPLR